jgi:hypothetical protein
MGSEEVLQWITLRAEGSIPFDFGELTLGQGRDKIPEVSITAGTVGCAPEKARRHRRGRGVRAP